MAYVRASLLGNTFLLVAILDYSNSMAVFNSKEDAKSTNKRRQSLEILKKRFAKGEITKEEYQEIKNTLDKD